MRGLPQGEDRPRGADHEIEAFRACLLESHLGELLDVLLQLLLLFLAEGCAAAELGAKALHAELHAATEPHFVGVPDDQLDAAATDVDDEGALLGQVHRVADGEIDVARFFCAGDDLRRDPGVLGNGVQELAAVLRFAHGCGRDGTHVRDAVALRELHELADGFQAEAHGFVCQAAVLEDALAQEDHLLLAVDDLERVIAPSADHDHVDRVGPNVDCGELHAVPRSLDRAQVSDSARESHDDAGEPGGSE